MIPVYATRPDGWPLCPMCHEDELYSLFGWDGSDPKPPMQAWIDHGLRCYRCGWDSTEAPAITSSSKEFVDRINESHARLMAFIKEGVVMCISSAEELATRRAAVAAMTAPPLPPRTEPIPVPSVGVRYGHHYCKICDLDTRYCSCGTTPAGAR